jgi:hypothetical protein
LADLAKGMNSKSSVIAERLGSIKVIGAKPLPSGQQRSDLVRMADLGRTAIFGSSGQKKGARIGKGFQALGQKPSALPWSEGCKNVH